MSTSQKALYRFFCAYFYQHEALSRTTSALSDAPYYKSIDWLSADRDLVKTEVNSLLGCSHELIGLVSDISDLASEIQLQSYNHPVHAQPEYQLSLEERRDSIELSLRCLRQDLPVEISWATETDGSKSNASAEILHIAETRRLTALIYLHFRVDRVAPSDPRIRELTSQILEIIPEISLRSHALLWTLFIVGTMGISQTDGGSYRSLILEKMVSLQHTRELEHVKIARRVMETVWDLRDLTGTEGWEEIVIAGGEGLSLC